PDLSGEGVRGRDAVDQGDDVGVPGPVDVGIAVAVHVAHAGGQGQDVLVVPSENRQGLDELGAETRLGRRVLQVDDLRPGPHFDPLPQARLGLQYDLETDGAPGVHL